MFTDDLLETWIEYKRLNEVDAIRLRPHPWEFMLYYDIEEGTEQTGASCSPSHLLRCRA